MPASPTGVAGMRSPRRSSRSTSVVAYDMRGYGETTAATYGFTHLDDLGAVLDQVATGPVWLVGSSMGGEVAIDAALSHPDRIAGLVLLAPSVQRSAGTRRRSTADRAARAPLGGGADVG